jgi:molecular chaperone DnaK (HSP70)
VWAQQPNADGWRDVGAGVGRQPLLHDPDECVAKGAAIQAALIDAEARAAAVMKIFRCLPFGGARSGAQFGRSRVVNATPNRPCYPALTRLPVTQVRHGYTTTTDNQEFVQIRIYEASRATAKLRQRAVGVFNLPTADRSPASATSPSPFAAMKTGASWQRRATGTRAVKRAFPSLAGSPHLR